MAAMTTHTKRKSAVVGMAVLLVALLAGCGGGDDIEAFCTDSQAIQSGEFMMDVDPEDADAVGKAAEDGIAQIKAIKAPSGIADDWATFTDALGEYLTAFKDLDMTSEEGMEKIAEITEAMYSDEIATAGDNVDAFISENCEA